METIKTNKKLLAFITATILITCLFSIYAFRPADGQYKYMTVLAQTTGNGKGLNISTSNDFKHVELPIDSKGWYDFNFFVKYIEEFESYGWQLEGSVVYGVSPNGYASCFAILKKAK